MKPNLLITALFFVTQFSCMNIKDSADAKEPVLTQGRLKVSQPFIQEEVGGEENGESNTYLQFVIAPIHTNELTIDSIIFIHPNLMLAEQFQSTQSFDKPFRLLLSSKNNEGEIVVSVERLHIYYRINGTNYQKNFGQILTKEPLYLP